MVSKKHAGAYRIQVGASSGTAFNGSAACKEGSGLDQKGCNPTAGAEDAVAPRGGRARHEGSPRQSALYCEKVLLQVRKSRCEAELVLQGELQRMPATKERLGLAGHLGVWEDSLAKPHHGLVPGSAYAALLRAASGLASGLGGIPCAAMGKDYRAICVCSLSQAAPPQQSAAVSPVVLGGECLWQGKEYRLEEADNTNRTC